MVEPMDYRKTMINSGSILYSMTRYNMKIIFANKFIFFLIAALGVFIFVTVMNVLNTEANITEGTVYMLLLVPGILLVFYPTAFGIQNDVDTRMIEILFGIPNYRYKVWMVRLLMIFVMVFAILLMLSAVSNVALTGISVLGMTVQVMFPILFFGSLAFMLSTVIGNGSGTAVVMIILGLGIWIAQSSIGKSQWNVFLNPFIIPQNVNEIVWNEITTNNRVYLVIATIMCILMGLLNLQKREKFV
jgi:hypothetical protein